MRGAPSMCESEGALGREALAHHARTARVAAWRRPRPVLDAALLAASLLLCTALVFGPLV